MSNDTYLDVLHQAHSSLQTEKDVLELGSGEDDESETGQPKVKIEGETPLVKLEPESSNKRKSPQIYKDETVVTKKHKTDREERYF